MSLPRILIVDDARLNRELLAAHLEGEGYELSFAETGEAALETVAAARPDLILLDVHLGAGIDGYEVARRLKQAREEEFLPVVLVTALADRESRIEGLGAGADEFLTKPVDGAELLLRVKGLLALRAQERQLARRNLELVELQRFREEMSSLIVHDLKNPVTALIGNLDYLVNELRSASPGVLEALEDSNDASRRILRLLANLADNAKAEAGKLDVQRRPVPLAPLLGRIVEQRRNIANVRGIKMTVEAPRDLTLAADVDLLTRVMENILDNALRYAPLGGVISAAAKQREPGQAELRFGNSGPAISPEDQQRIFEKYGQTSARVGRMNLGLGLYFCRLAVEAMGGSIRLDRSPELPTIFAITLPATA